MSVLPLDHPTNNIILLCSDGNKVACNADILTMASDILADVIELKRQEQVKHVAAAAAAVAAGLRSSTDSAGSCPTSITGTHSLHDPNHSTHSTATNSMSSDNAGCGQPADAPAGSSKHQQVLSLNLHHDSAHDWLQLLYMLYPAVAQQQPQRQAPPSWVGQPHLDAC